MLGFWDAVASAGPYAKKSAPRSRQITTPVPHHSIFTLWTDDMLHHTWYTHTHTFNGPFSWTTLCPGLPSWASTRKVKPVGILLKQETVSGSGVSWAICKSAPHSRQITTPAPHQSVFFTGRIPFLPSKHWRQASSYVMLPAVVCSAWRWMFSSDVVCCFVCQVGHAYSKTGRMTVRKCSG